MGTEQNQTVDQQSDLFQVRIERALKLSEEHLNPGLTALIKFMGFDTLEDTATGSIVRDVRGDEFIDCLGGFGVFAFGHRHPTIVAAVRDQLERMPLGSKVILNSTQIDLAAALAAITPGDLQYSFFCNSGAEANEAAIKFARLATDKTDIIATHGAFHGKTMGALSASGREVYRAPFAPLLPGFSHVPFGDAATVEAAITASTAAVIVEPIQGEAGVIVPPDGYLADLRRVCDRHGILLIVDEVQTGMGRTGTAFACEHDGVAPDLMTLAKALGGGVMPIGALIGTERVWRAMTDNPLLHSSTFGGNPLACTAGLAAVRVLQEEKLAERAAAIGQYAKDGLNKVQRDFPGMISEVRGRGLLIGVEFAHEDIGGLVIAGLAQRKIIAAYTLNNPKVIRFEPPLTIPEALVDRVLEAFHESVAQTAELLEGVV